VDWLRFGEASSTYSVPLTDVKERTTERHVGAEGGGAPGSATLWGQHSAVLSIGLHLLPGVFTGAAFLALSPQVITAGYPPHLALVLAVPLALLPVSVGLLLYSGYRRNGHLSLDGLVLNREPVRIRQFLAYVPLVFLTSLVVFAVLGSVLDGPLHEAAFAWMPSLDWGLGGGYGRGALVFTFALAALFVVLLASTVEEVYFRGFLLPRMDYAGRWAVPLHIPVRAVPRLDVVAGGLAQCGHCSASVCGAPDAQHLRSDASPRAAQRLGRGDGRRIHCRHDFGLKRFTSAMQPLYARGFHAAWQQLARGTITDRPPVRSRLRSRSAAYPEAQPPTERLGSVRCEDGKQH
jgi:membrane protease YdiL (CAAX protease family)